MSLSGALYSHAANAQRMSDKGLLVDQQAAKFDANAVDAAKVSGALQLGREQNATELAKAKLGQTPQVSAAPNASSQAQGGLSAGFSAKPTDTATAWRYDAGSGQYGYGSDITKPTAVGQGIMGMAKGGPVNGQAGIDQVPATGPQGEPVRLSKGEYILPVAVVEALGGIDALDKLVETVTGEKPTPGGEPMPPLPEQVQGLEALAPGKGLKGFVDGGAILDWAGKLNPVGALVKGMTHSKEAGAGSDKTGGDYAAGQAQLKAAQPAVDPNAAVTKAWGERTRATIQQNEQRRQRAAAQQGGLSLVRQPEPVLDTAALDAYMGPGGEGRRTATAMGNAQGPNVMQDAGPSWEGSPYASGPRHSGGVTRTPSVRPARSANPLSSAPRAGLDVLANDGGALAAIQRAPASMGGLRTIAEQRSPQAQALIARASSDGPGDNVTDTGITGKDSQGRTQKVYKNTFAAGSPEAKEYGGAIYSDSFRGATKQGFNEDFAKSGGNYVGDPATGKGFHLPKDIPNTQAGLDAVMQGYAPARENMASAARAQAGLEVMRQYTGKGLSLEQQGAPDEVMDLFNRPRNGESRTQMEFRQNAPAQAAMEHRRALELEAIKGEANRPQPDPKKDPVHVARERFFPINKENPEQSNQHRAWAEGRISRVMPILQPYGVTPDQLYAAFAYASPLIGKDGNDLAALQAASKQLGGIDLVRLLNSTSQ